MRCASLHSVRESERQMLFENLDRLWGKGWLLPDRAPPAAGWWRS